MLERINPFPLAGRDRSRLAPSIP